MEAAKPREKEPQQRPNPCPDRYFSVILKEITGEREVKNAAAKLRFFVEDGSLLACGWSCRRLEIVKAIERQSWDLEAVTRLANLLDLDPDDSAMVEQLEEIRLEIHDAFHSVSTLDRLLAQAASACLLQPPKLASRVLRAWLSLEIQFRPDERGLLAGLRDRLVCEAERREVDLRGLGI